jgi:hypothetical protein
MRGFGCSFAVVVIVCSLPIGAAAQPVRAWEVAGGYQTIDNVQDRVSLLGWTADAAVRVIPWLSAVGETGAASRTVGDVALHQFAVLGGARAAARIGPFSEFVQLLAGASRSPSEVLGESVPDNGYSFTLQPGGGVDIPLGGRFAARLQIDRRSFVGGEFAAEDRHEIRLSAALVFHPLR